jgi:ABC-type dipeptide/oligopeptide/nickel transport system ATPase component
MVVVCQAHERVGRRAALARAVEALRAVGIADPERRLSAYPHELSGGMAQRVCIAMSLLHSPRLLVADEPTAGLDVTVQRQVLDQLVAAARDRNAAQLVVTRDLGIVAQYCQRVAVMRGGRIVESGPTAEVFRQPQHPYTVQLLRAVGIGVPPRAPSATDGARRTPAEVTE